MEGTILLYAALLALVLLALSYNVVRLRRRHQIGIGTGGNEELARAVRAQANFCEYVPLALLLLALIEFSARAPGWSLHLLGFALVVGRVLHGFGLARSSGASKGRVAGTLLTWLVLLSGAGLALGLAVASALA